MRGLDLKADLVCALLARVDSARGFKYQIPSEESCKPEPHVKRKAHGGFTDFDAWLGEGRVLGILVLEIEI